MNEQIETQKRLLIECKRCGYRWFGRTNSDGTIGGKVCPGCKSPYWNTEKTMHLYHKAKYKGDLPQ